MENWKIIKGFPDYAISNKGNIKSFKRNKAGVLLKLIIDSRGYYVVNLCVNSKMYQRMVHSLVAEHFLNNPNNYKVVNHKDLNKLNNDAENLEWCSTRENVSHYYKSCESSSKYIGVSKAGNNFRCQLVANKVRYCFGCYKSDIEAKNIYDKALAIFLKDGIEALIIYNKLIKKK